MLTNCFFISRSRYSLFFRIFEIFKKRFHLPYNYFRSIQVRKLELELIINMMAWRFYWYYKNVSFLYVHQKLMTKKIFYEKNDEIFKMTKKAFISFKITSWVLSKLENWTWNHLKEEETTFLLMYENILL